MKNLINLKNKFILGIDFGFQNLKLGACDLNGNMICSVK